MVSSVLMYPPPIVDNVSVLRYAVETAPATVSVLLIFAVFMVAVDPIAVEKRSVLA